MNTTKTYLLAFVIALGASPLSSLLAIEEAEYTVIAVAEEIEVRDYASSIVAETLVYEDFEDAGSRAFRKLFNYISGDNEARDKIAMTSPVSQEKRSEKIAMTSPVEQRPSGDGWTVSFMMPSSYTMETIPLPTNPDVTIREIPAYRAAAIRFSGRWTEKNYFEHLAQLQAWISDSGYEAEGEPIWARYDPPFKPWFMRRNEILIPIR